MIVPCACLGPRNNEPFCNCRMEQLGLQRSQEHALEQQRVNQRIKEFMPKLFGPGDLE